MRLLPRLISKFHGILLTAFAIALAASLTVIHSLVSSSSSYEPQDYYFGSAILPPLSQSRDSANSGAVNSKHNFTQVRTSSEISSPARVRHPQGKHVQSPLAATISGNDSLPVDQEYPYRLSCPGQVLHKANYSVILGYHVGMLRNWETIVRDQLHTLQKCGLGAALDHWFVSYSPPTSRSLANHLINHLLQEFTTTYGIKRPDVFPSSGLPWEGAVMNSMRDYCLQQEKQDKLNFSKKATVVFYWHTKGSSRWKAKWRDQMKEPYTYSRVLYWRKYMEYFLHERPSHCIDRIVNHGALTCGVYRQPARGVYAGNFWAASCRYLVQLPELAIRKVGLKTSNKKLETGYFDAEEIFGKYQNDSSATSQMFVSLHQPPRGEKGFYYKLIERSEYAHTIENWGPDV